MHAEFGLVDTSTASTVLNVAYQVLLALQLFDFRCVEDESKPSLFVLMLSIFVIRNITSEARFQKNTTRFKSLGVESVLPASKGLVPRFYSLL